MPAGFSLRLDLPWTCVPAEELCLGILGSLQSKLPDFTLAIVPRCFPTFWQYRKYGWVSAYVEGRESLATIASAEALAGSSGSLRVTPDSQGSSVHPFSSLAACVVTPAATQPALMGPNRGLHPQVAALKPGLEVSTSLLSMGETGIVEVMASSGQSSLCGSFSLSQSNDEPNKTFPGWCSHPCLVWALSPSLPQPHQTPSWKFSRLRWFFSFDWGNSSPSDTFTAST